ncbi:EAL domain-containing protein [Cyanobacterium aponinum UTEX 3222]|uniref:EAL domain-containing protein n=1 Tax=Cyanobacterium aponinum TaxID=379064 RepID=UPI0030852F56|nr:EAL domain-containing protein [Cyanobacterium aponinum UTEX 3222]
MNDNFDNNENKIVISDIELETLADLNKYISESLINHYLILEESTSIQKLIKTFLLEENILTIGRSDKNNIQLSSLEVSRFHAHLKKFSHPETHEIYYEVIDGSVEGKKSNNGLNINGKKVSRAKLKHGDIINIGSEVIFNYFIDHEGKFEKQKTTILEQKNLVIDTVANDEDEKTKIIKNSTISSGIDQLLKFASIVNLSPYPIIEIDTTGKINFLNNSAKINFPTLLTENKNHLIFKDILAIPENLETDLFKREIKIDTTYFEQYVHYIKDQKIIRTYLLNITSRKKQQDSIKKLLDYDLKTKLPNYRFFIKTLQTSIPRHQRIQQNLAIMLIELDQIDLGKETLTPQKEQNIYIYCADKLNKLFRVGDTIAYWKNYQFIILLSNIQENNQIGLISQRVIDSLKTPFENQNIKTELKINIGISVYPYDADNSSDLIRKADQALSNSKKLGSNTYAFFSAKINFDNQVFSLLSNHLNKALQNQEFIIYYQPIVNREHQIIALESLLRWQHPTKGILSPDEFLSIAENQKIINDITIWMIEDIIAKKRSYSESVFRDIPIAMNISRKLIEDQKHSQRFIKIIEDNIAYTHNLIIEIRDNIWLENPEGKAILKKLLSLGLKIALDDFGHQDTLFTSIKKFPFHYLKISQDFVKNIKDNYQDKAIVSAISTMAKGLNMEVIVEGIENEIQWIIVLELDCQYAQGYLFTKALPFEEIMAILEY